MEVVGDGDARISYRGNWSVQNATGADQGSVHSSTDPAGVISLKFVGSSIQIDAVKSPNGANFTVILDTSTYGPYSLYSPTTTVGNVWSQSQLNPTATHTIALQKVQATAGPDSTRALNVDVFRIAAAASSSSSSSATSSSTTSTSQSTSTSSPRQEPTSSSSTTTISRPPSSFLTSSSSNLRPEPSSFILDTIPILDTEPAPSPDTEPTPTPDDTYTNDVSDDPIPQPAPAPTTSSRSSTTLSRNSTSSSSTRSATTIVAFSLSHYTSTSASAAAVGASENTPGPDNRTSIILGTIVGAVIFLCLVTIPIIYIKRKREENLAQELKASTTPAYQTRTTKGLLMPLGIYRRPTSTRSPTSPTSINHRWGFGSQTNYGQSVSPSATSPSPIGGAARRTSFEDTERSHYLIYPDAAPGSDPADYRGHALGRTDSISSDYPYPVIYHTPR